jgi:hypothetical protein
MVGEAIAVITEYFAHGRMAAYGRRPGTKNVCDRRSACQRASRTLPAANSIKRGDEYIWPDRVFNVSCYRK